MKNSSTLSNNHFKTIIVLIIALLTSVRGISQQMTLPEGVTMWQPKGAIQLNHEQLVAFIDSEKYPKYFVKMRHENIFRLKDVLIGVAGIRGSFKPGFDKAKVQWYKNYGKYEGNPNYKFTVKHENDYDLLTESSEEKNSVITVFFAAHHSNTLLIQGTIVSHPTSQKESTEVLNDMLGSLKFAEVP